MEPIITDCYYKSNKSDDVAAFHNLNTVPSNFPSTFVVENGKLVLYYYMLAVYIGTGLLRNLHNIESREESQPYVNLRGSVCYNAKQDEYTSWNFGTKQRDTQFANRFYRLSMDVVSNLSNEDYLSWFVRIFDTADFLVQYSLTNLLGQAGSFGTDSNNDGLADGWNISSDLGKQIEQVDGINWQHFWETYSISSRGIYKELNMIPNNIYFVTMKQKVTTTDTDTRFAGTVRFYDYNTSKDSGIAIPKFPYESVGSQLLRYGVITALSAKPSIIIYTSFGGLSVSGKRYDVWVAQVGVYDLSVLGRLPNGLANYLGVLRWTDLATSSMIRALDGTIKSGVDWLSQFIPYIESTQTINFVLNFPFKTAGYYQYKPYIFKYDSQYRATLEIGEPTKTDSAIVELTYEFEGRNFKVSKELLPNELTTVELIAMLSSTNDAVSFSNVFGGYNSRNNTVANEYSFYLNTKSVGLWYYDRAKEKASLYPINEIMLIHKDNLDKLGEPIIIGEVEGQRLYITPFTHSKYAIILLPDEDVRVALRRAGLSETFWKVEGGRFVIDSAFWYSLYINLLEEFSSPEDDKYEIVNGVYVSNNQAIPAATTAFSVSKQGDDWYLVFDRTKLTEPAEEFYCLVTLWDIFDNFDTTFIFATGYVDYAGKRHKTYTTRFTLDKTAFTLSEGTNIIPLGKYLKLEDDR